MCFKQVFGIGIGLDKIFVNKQSTRDYSEPYMCRVKSMA